MLYPLTIIWPVYFSSSGGVFGAREDIVEEEVRFECTVGEAGDGTPNTARYDF